MQGRGPRYPGSRHLWRCATPGSDRQTGADDQAGIETARTASERIPSWPTAMRR